MFHESLYLLQFEGSVPDSCVVVVVELRHSERNYAFDEPKLTNQFLETMAIKFEDDFGITEVEEYQNQSPSSTAFSYNNGNDEMMLNSSPSSSTSTALTSSAKPPSSKPRKVRKNRARNDSETTSFGGSNSNRVDSKSKLERSRQSARECRARKKLRYQYLEDLVARREAANITLKQEIDQVRYSL